MVEREQLIAMVQGTQNADPEAAGLIYETFRDDFYYFILKTVKKDRDLAEDLTQDTFVEILEKIQTLEEPAAFVTWAKQIAYHKCTDYFKKHKELLLDENEDGTTILDTLVDDDKDFIPDEALDVKELKQTILDMINELPAEQRSAILLRYFNEISVKEIAQIQDVTEGTVKSRLNYARKAIKQSVEAYEKNNIKLHCVGVLPLLLWLFRQYRLENGLSLSSGTASQTYTAMAEIPVVSATVPVAEAAASSGGVTATTPAAVKTAAVAGAKAISGKVIAAVVAAALAIGGVATAIGLSGKENTEAEDIRTTVAAEDVDHVDSGSPADAPEKSEEAAKPSCTHSWKHLYYLHEADDHFGLSFYGCTDCRATVLGEACDHPEDERAVLYDNNTVEICGMCGVLTSDFAPGGENLPAYTYPQYYREAEPNKAGCKHIWKTDFIERVPLEGYDSEKRLVCVSHYQCALCNEKLVGYGSGHGAEFYWEGTSTGDCWRCLEVNHGDPNCNHYNTYKIYYPSAFAGEAYYQICKDCDAIVLAGVPAETEKKDSEGDSELVPVETEYMTFYLPKD